MAAIWIESDEPQTSKPKLPCSRPVCNEPTCDRWHDDEDKEN
jgi:hypothetical protein